MNNKPDINKFIQRTAATLVVEKEEFKKIDEKKTSGKTNDTASKENSKSKKEN